MFGPVAIKDEGICRGNNKTTSYLTKFELMCKAG